MTVRWGSPGEADARQAQLTTMFQSLLKKAHALDDPATAEPAMINIVLDGAGQPLTAGMGGIIQIPYPCRILAATIYAGVTSLIGVYPSIASATIYLGLSTAANGNAWSNGLRPLYGSAVPELANEDSVGIDVTDWVRELQPYDVIAYALTTFTGTASLLTLALLVKKLDVQGLGVSGVSSDGDTIVSGSDLVVFRQ